MAKQSLAVKYRPKTWDDVTEQKSIKTILQQQLQSGEIQHAYLFVGGAGTGKTTCARIFANDINKGMGTPIELDAASNNGVDDVRDIIQKAKLKSLDSEYKVFIIDECHSLSNQAWQAFLKLLEEPPAKSLFIFCTTNPEKIPRTILSRVQRYDFQRISQQGIVDRLKCIIVEENAVSPNWETESVEYIAKLADGGMRDAITMMDKCLAYSDELTVENVVKVLGTVDYKLMEDLTVAITKGNGRIVVETIEEVHAEGKDLHQFMKSYLQFVLDVYKYTLTKSFDYITIPQTEEAWLKKVASEGFVDFILAPLVRLIDAIKYDASPKTVIEVRLLELTMED